MRGALGGPRVLLRRLREVMAEPVSAQERLDKIVVLIAANMVAEVCSVYVLRVDGTLELYATEGLKPRGRPPDRAALRRRPGRPGRERGQPDQPVRRAEPPGLLLPAGNRRRNLPLLPRRADPARRQHARRAGGAEPRAAHLFRGGRGGAADHRDGAGRDDRLGRALGARPARRAEPAARRPLHLDRHGAQRRHRARPRRAARAARRHHQCHRRRRAEGAEAARSRDRDAARRSRRAARARRRRRRRRASRRARSLPHVRPRPRLAAPARRSGADRPHRRGRRRARAVGHPRAHAARRPIPICASGCTTSTTSPTG